MRHVTLLTGDGIGPEITTATKKVLDAAGAELAFDEFIVGETSFKTTGEHLPEEVFDNLEKNKLALKGPITTPIGHGFRSLNVHLRKKYDLYANVRPIKAPGPIPLKFDGVDLVIFRENTEDLYAGVEQKISDDEFQSVKIITSKATRRIAKAAFDYAVAHHRKKVSIVTKANIMKLSDGLFLRVCREVAKDYPMIEVEEVLVDNMAMQLVLHPEKYDLILTQNLYGDILSDLSAGLVGGIGLAPGANIGEDMAIFEAVHGSAPDIAGKNMANPTAMILSSCMLLDYIGQQKIADRIRKALHRVYETPANYPADLGGNISTTGFTDLVLYALEESYAK